MRYRSFLRAFMSPVQEIINGKLPKLCWRCGVRLDEEMSSRASTVRYNEIHQYLTSSRPLLAWAVAYGQTMTTSCVQKSTALAL